jgi:hypothetical protein
MNAMQGIRALLLPPAWRWGWPRGSLAADTHKHDHGAAPARLELNNGQKWQTDAPLRKACRISATAMDAVHLQHPRAQAFRRQYGALAKRVNGEVSGIVANCKLEPQADAQLHLVIAETSSKASRRWKARRSRSSARPVR